MSSVYFSLTIPLVAAIWGCNYGIVKNTVLFTVVAQSQCSQVDELYMYTIVTMQTSQLTVHRSDYSRLAYTNSLTSLYEPCTQGGGEN